MVGVVQGLDPLDVGWDVRDQDPAAQPVVVYPPHVRDGVVDVVEEDLPDAGPPLGAFADEVGQPAVVGPDPGQPPGIVLVGGRGGEQDEAGEEGWDGVREDHLGDHPVRLLVGPAAGAVPVADPQVGVLQVLVGVAVLVPPRVELVDERRIEVLPVLRVTAAGVGVGGDDRVVIGHY